jgi:hypothetical protein
MISTRPNFANLDSFKAYAAEGFKGFPMAQRIRYEIALAGVCMTVDAYRMAA